jgi:hypothetical protein
MKKALLVLLLAFGVVFAAQAQEALKDGVGVEGEISNDTPSVNYSYEGEAKQILVLQLKPADILGDYDRPKVVVTAPDGSEVVEYDSFGRLQLVVELPVDGTYTITVTREDSESVGKYTVTAFKPVTLAIGEAVQDTITNEEIKYYVYRGDADFNLSFVRTGTFAPEVSVNVLATFLVGTLDSVGGAYGVSKAEIGTFDGGNLYIIKVAEALFDFNFSTVTAEYSLTLTAAE